MSYDEIQHLTEIERITNGKPGYLDMDEALCTRMHAAIEAGLESAPIGIIKTPGTRNAQIRLGPNREIPSSGRRAITGEE
jgi:hypothetical protein